MDRTPKPHERNHGRDTGGHELTSGALAHSTGPHTPALSHLTPGFSSATRWETGPQAIALAGYLEECATKGKNVARRVPESALPLRLGMRGITVYEVRGLSSLAPNPSQEPPLFMVGPSGKNLFFDSLFLRHIRKCHAGVTEALGLELLDTAFGETKLTQRSYLWRSEVAEQAFKRNLPLFGRIDNLLALGLTRSPATGKGAAERRRSVPERETSPSSPTEPRQKRNQIRAVLQDEVGSALQGSAATQVEVTSNLDGIWRFDPLHNQLVVDTSLLTLQPTEVRALMKLAMLVALRAGNSISESEVLRAKTAVTDLPKALHLGQITAQDLHFAQSACLGLSGSGWNTDRLQRFITALQRAPESRHAVKMNRDDEDGDKRCIDLYYFLSDLRDFGFKHADLLCRPHNFDGIILKKTSAPNISDMLRIQPYCPSLPADALSTILSHDCINLGSHTHQRGEVFGRVLTAYGFLFHSERSMLEELRHGRTPRLFDERVLSGAVYKAAADTLADKALVGIDIILQCIGQDRATKIFLGTSHQQRKKLAGWLTEYITDIVPDPTDPYRSWFQAESVDLRKPTPGPVRDSKEDPIGRISRIMDCSSLLPRFHLWNGLGKLRGNLIQLRRDPDAPVLQNLCTMLQGSLVEHGFEPAAIADLLVSKKLETRHLSEGTRVALASWSYDVLQIEINPTIISNALFVRSALSLPCSDETVQRLITIARGEDTALILDNDPSGNLEHRLFTYLLDQRSSPSVREFLNSLARTSSRLPQSFQLCAEILSKLERPEDRSLVVHYLVNRWVLNPLEPQAGMFAQQLIRSLKKRPAVERTEMLDRLIPDEDHLRRLLEGSAPAVFRDFPLSECSPQILGKHFETMPAGEVRRLLDGTEATTLRRATAAIQQPMHQQDILRRQVYETMLDSLPPEAQDLYTGKMKPNYFAILGVPRGFSQEDLRSSYRALMFLYHSDRNQNSGDLSETDARSKLIREAYEILSGKDPDATLDYLDGFPNDFSFYPKRVWLKDLPQELSEWKSRDEE